MNYSKWNAAGYGVVLVTVVCGYRVAITLADPPTLSDEAQLSALLTQQPGGYGYGFGFSIAVDDDVAVICASNSNNGLGIIDPRAYVFERMGTTWKRVARLTVSFASTPEGGRLSLPDIQGDLIAMACPPANGGAGATCLFERPASGWTDMTETAILTASDGMPGDQFGRASISGDVIVVAASEHDNGVPTSNFGALYVFEKSGAQWVSMTQNAKLTASPGGSRLGLSVAIDDSVIVGSNTGISSEGRLFVFERPATGWTNSTQTAILTHTGGMTAMGLIGLDIEKDVTVASGTSAAAVFVRSGSQWTNMTQTARLIATGPASERVDGDVAMEGDIIAAGAFLAHNGIPGSEQGAVYLFQKPAMGWVDTNQIAKLTAANPSASDRAGEALTMRNGVVYSGVSGADLDVSIINDGRVDIFEEPKGGWADTQSTGTIRLLANGDLSQGDWLGYAVAMDGDIAVVGAQLDDEPLHNSGSCYVFQRVSARWQRVAKLTPTDPTAGRNFGAAVAVRGDTIVVGCFSGFNLPVYVFVRPPNGWTNATETARLTASGHQSFGRSVAVSDDTIVVGGPTMNNNLGAVFVYERPVGGWVNASETKELTPSGITWQSGDGYGIAVATTDEFILATAYRTDVGGSNTGSAFVFQRPNGGWSRSATHIQLTPSNPVAGARFGEAASMRDGTIVIGAPGHVVAGQISGLAYVYERSGSVWTNMSETARLSITPPLITNLGRAVSVHDEAVVVGGGSGGFAGAAFAFVRPARDGRR
jgi:hypothetical protein